MITFTQLCEWAKDKPKWAALLNEIMSDLRHLSDERLYEFRDRAFEDEEGDRRAILVEWAQHEMMRRGLIKGMQ